MAVNTRARASGKSRAEVAAQRDVRVPLRRKIGTAWLMRCCYWLRMRPIITGVALPVDAGAALKVG